MSKLTVDNPNPETKPAEQFISAPLWQRDPDIMQRGYEPMPEVVKNQPDEAENVVSEKQNANDD
jgi:hypothetical protein